MKVIWIDPGETVGWATAVVTTGTRGSKLEQVEWGMTKLKPFALKLLDRASSYDIIGYETYTIRPDRLRAHAGSTVPTLQLVGMIRLATWAACVDNDFCPQLIAQAPGKQSAGMGAATLYFDKRTQAALREALDGPHSEGHHGSALLHLAAWYHDNYAERWLIRRSDTS